MGQETGPKAQTLHEVRTAKDRLERALAESISRNVEGFVQDTGLPPIGIRVELTAHRTGFGVCDRVLITGVKVDLGEI